MKIVEKIKRITMRKALAKIKILSLVLLMINIVVLFVSAYGYILFGITVDLGRTSVVAAVSSFLFFLYVVLEGEGY